MSKPTLILVGLAALTLAGVAATVSAWAVADGSMDVPRWALTTLTSAGAALCLVLSFSRSGPRRPPAWATAAAALSLAALLPLAGAACELRERADAALLCTAVAVFLIIRAERRSWHTVAAGILVAAAVALDFTAIILPLGLLLAARLGGRTSRPPLQPPASPTIAEVSRPAPRPFRSRAAFLFGAAVIGQAVASLIGLPVACTIRDATRVGALHRDLLLLLPVILLGLGGWTDPVARRSGHAHRSWLIGPSTLGCLGLIGVLAGAPLSVRLLVLPLWWWVPAGLMGLASLCTRRTVEAAVARRLGYAVCGMLIVLCCPAGRRWGDCLLLLVYWLTGP